MTDTGTPRLGLQWGGGLENAQLLARYRRQTDGGVRLRIGTELFRPHDTLANLRRRLGATPLEWADTEITPARAFAICEAQGLPVLLCIDPMDPGAPDGAGYHQQELQAALSFPSRLGGLAPFADLLLELIATDWPRLEIAAVQWGNEVGYAPWISDLPTAYEAYGDALKRLAPVVHHRHPGLTLLAGGPTGDPEESDGTQSLTWWCGQNLDVAEMALDFHLVYTAEMGAAPQTRPAKLFNHDDPALHGVSPEAIAQHVHDTAAGLRKAFPQRDVWLSEWAGREFADLWGEAAIQGGCAALYYIADLWLERTWGPTAGLQADSTTLGLVGPDGPNEANLDAFGRLARQMNIE